MSILISWLILSLAVWLTALVLPGVRLRGVGGALIVAAVFGILNWLVGWLLFVLIGVVTLGLGFLLAFLTRWVVNAALLLATARLVDSLEVKGFGWALLAAGLMSAIGTLAQDLVCRAL